jgi:hypothetical protein
MCPTHPQAPADETGAGRRGQCAACARSDRAGGVLHAVRGQRGAAVRTAAFRISQHQAVHRPAGPGRYKLQLTASQALHDKVQKARDLMRHELPDGDLAQLVERALDLLIEDRMKRRFGVGRKAKSTAHRRSANQSPAAVTSRTRSGAMWWRAMACVAASSVRRPALQRAWHAPAPSRAAFWSRRTRQHAEHPHHVLCPQSAARGAGLWPEVHPAAGPTSATAHARCPARPGT